MAEVVKIDKELMKKIEELIKKEKFLFANKKQVINLAIIEFLNARSFKEKRKVIKKRGK